MRSASISSSAILTIIGYPFPVSSAHNRFCSLFRLGQRYDIGKLAKLVGHASGHSQGNAHGLMDADEVSFMKWSATPLAWASTFFEEGVHVHTHAKVLAFSKARADMA